MTTLLVRVMSLIGERVHHADEALLHAHRMRHRTA